MADNKKDVTLVIRAQNEAKAEFQRLADLVKKVETGFDGAQDSADELKNSITALSSGKAGKFFLETEQAVSRTNLEYRKSQLEIKQLAARLREMKSVVGPMEPAKAKEFNSELKKTEAEFARTEQLLKRQSAEYRNQLALLRQIRQQTGSNNAAAFNARVGGLSFPAGAPRPSPGAAPTAPGLPKYDPTGPRQTLDFYQRLRGQALALTNSYVGLYSAVNQVNKALQEQAQTKGIEARLGATLGTTDPKVIGDEMTRLRQEAERLGQAFLPLAGAYSKFNASARLSGASGATVNTVFRNISEAATVLNLSTEEVEGTFLGLTQIFNKQKVTAEDFRGQVAERLPGAMAVLAQSLKVPVSDLDKLFQKGAIGAEAMVQFSIEYQKQVQSGLIPATQTLSRDLDRLGNDAMEMRKVFIDAATPGLLEAIASVREAVKDPEFRESLRNAGELVGDMAKFLASLTPHLPMLIKFVGALVLLRGAQGAANLVNSIREVAAIATGAATAGQTVSSVGAAIGTFTAVAARLAPILRIIGTALLGPAGVVAAVGLLGVAVAKTTFEQDNWLKSLISLGQSFTYVGERQKALAKQDAEREAKRKSDEAAKKAAQELAIAQAEAEARARERSVKALKDEVEELRKANQAEGDPRAKALQDKQERDANIRKLAEDARKNINADSPDRGAQAKEIREAKMEGLRQSYEQFRKEIDKIDQEANEKAQAAIDKKLADEEAALKRKIDLQRDVNELAFAGPKTDAQKAQELQAEIDVLEQRIRASKDLNAEEKERLSTQLQIAAQTRVEAINRQSLIDKAKEQSDLADRLTEARDARIRTLQAEGEASGRDPVETARLIREEYEKTTPAIIAALEAQIRFQEALGGPEAEAKVEVLKASIAELKNIPAQLDPIALKAKEIKDQFADGLANAFVDFAKGTKDARTALKDFATDFLSFIAQAIIKKTILNALDSSGTGGFFNALAGAVLHEGGTVGASGGRSRTMSAAAFVGAPRFHNGGMPGLKQDEVAAVLQKGEEVLPQNDPRHIANINKAAVAEAAAPQVNLKMVNAIDSASVVREGLAAPGTERVFMNFIRANATSIRQALG